MPNWCSTIFNFHGSKEELVKLNSKISEWTSKSFIKTDFGNDWLGNILYGAELDERIDHSDENKELRCRGWITDADLDLENSTLTVETETAWCPMAKMWQAIIEKLEFKSIGFCYAAEECGCELYEIYDPKGYGDFDGCSDKFEHIDEIYE